MIGVLPETLSVNGVNYPIRTDYRNVLQVFEAFSDLELEEWEKWVVAVCLLFEDFHSADEVLAAVENGFDIHTAGTQIAWFIFAGKETDRQEELPTYSWEKDEQMIFSAVNKVAGMEVRELPYMHWWTFLGYFNEVGEGIFSFVVGIREKLNKGKKLEPHEREFYSKNKEMIKVERAKTLEEKEEETKLNSLLEEVLG